MKKRVWLSSVAALCIVGNVALAQETTQLTTVDVWETQVESSSLNLGSNAIETKQADHLSDLLRDIPGVDVGGTHSINNRINIRGLQDEDLEITLDGAKVQNANMFHHIGNLLINPDILKKASIQVGTNSVVNGSLGGAVSFETKDGKDMLEKGQNFGARFSTTYNSNNSLGGSVATYGKINPQMDFMLYHNYLNKDNWKDGSGKKTFGVDGTVNNTLVKLGYDVSDIQRISVSYDRLKDEGDYSPRPDFGAAYNEARTGFDTFPTEYIRDTVTLKHELSLGDLLTLNTSLYFNQNELERYEGPLTSGAPVRPGGLLEGLLNGKVRTVGINTKAQSNIESGNMLHTLTYGALFDKQSSKVTWNGAKYGTDEFAKSAAVYLEDAIDFDNGLIVTPGIRFNHYDFDGSYGKIKDNKMTYALATEYALNDELTLLASATTLYKGVQMVDVLATNRIGTSKNENLKSETGLNKEVGFRYLTQDVLGAKEVGFTFKYFMTNIDDYISNNYVGAGAFEIVNSGTLDIKGFETSFSYIQENWNALLTYSHSSSNFENTGEPAVKEPGDSLSLKLDYQIMPNLGLSWESLFVMKEDDRPNSTQYIEKEAYNVHDVSVKWEPKSYKGLTLIAGIDNIFDKEYVSHISENRIFNVSGSDVKTNDYEPGRNIKVTLSYKF